MNSEQAEFHSPPASAPHILVCTRFGLRVRDRAWLAHRLELISSITAPSLMAQRDQSFSWAILVDDGLPAEIRTDLEDLLAPFGDRAFLHWQRLHTQETLAEMVHDRGISGDRPYLVTARIDDDDAWSVAMVGAVRERVAAWLEEPDRAPGLTLTFQDGLEWIMYEMLDVDKLLGSGERLVHKPAKRRYRLPFIGTSVFICSPRSEAMMAIAGAHSRIAEQLSTTKGFASDVVSTDSPMWLCCRHKQVESGVRKARGAEVQLTLTELAAQFGLDEQRVNRYLGHADEHEYAVVKKLIGRKLKLGAELVNVNREINDPATTATQLRDLQGRKRKMAAEMAQLEVNTLGDPETMSPHRNQ